MQLEEVELSEEELIERKLMLEDCKIAKDETDMALVKYEKQLDAKIPLKMLEDDIALLEKNISEKKDNNGKDITEADLSYMQIELENLKKTKELDLPMRRLRLQIQSLRAAKNRIDSKERQIPKLEREIREKKATVPSSRARPDKTPIGVN
jgi:hypothetical protein